MWIHAKTLVLNALEDHGITGTQHMTAGIRWVKDAMRLIGFFPEYYLQAAEIEFDFNCHDIKKPDNFISPRSIYLCDHSGNITETYYGGRKPAAIFDPDGCCRFYSLVSNISGPVFMGEDDHAFFFMTGNSDQYARALLEYNGFKTDDEGNILVPEDAKSAVEQYITFKLTKRERKKDRNAVPHQEGQDEWALFERLAGIAKGKMKTPSVMEKHRQVYEKWANNLNGPRAKLR